MFNFSIFINNINAGKIKDALNMLLQSPDDFSVCNDDAITEIKARNKTPLIYELAKLVALSEALVEGSAHRDDAKRLLSLVMKYSDMHYQEEKTQRTAFSEAIYSDNREITDEMFTIIENDPVKKHSLYALLVMEDHQKNTSLHHAINRGNHALINKILEKDVKSYSLYFTRNKAGLFSFALALKNFQENQTFLSLSIMNQLYFTLPRGNYRTAAVEHKIDLGWGFFSKPLWRYALRMCAKRDEKNKIKNIDLNLWDFIVQVINDGLMVWGFNVTKDLIYEYSQEYSDTPGKALREVDKTREDGLAGRTLTQAATNTTLAKNKEFMKRANLEKANYYLCHSAFDPLSPGILNSLSTDRDWIILFTQQLFYVPQQGKNKARGCHEIEFKDLSDKEKVCFQSLQKTISKIEVWSSRSANHDEIKNIIPLVPLLIGQNDNVELMLMSRKGQTGMTLFAGSQAAASAKNNSHSLLPITNINSNNSGH